MRIIFPIAFLVMALLWVKERHRTNELVAKIESMEVKTEEPTTIELPPEATLPPAEPVETVAPELAENHLAPEGTYFLLTDMAIEDGDSLTGYRAGTRVIKRKEGEYMANGRSLKLREDQVTNDLRVVRQLYSPQPQMIHARPDFSAKNKNNPTPTPKVQTPGRLATREKNGWLWQKTPDGNYWTAVKRVDGKMDLKPGMERAR